MTVVSMMRSPAFAQSATTVPVGIVQVGVAAAPAGVDAFAYLGPCFLRAPAYHGRFSGNTAMVLTDAAAVWTLDQFKPNSGTTYFVEITSGASSGLIIDISGNTVTGLTVASPVSAASLGQQTYNIRPHSTLASLFGATNDAGLVGGDFATADIVSIWNGTAYLEYYFATGGWRIAGDAVTDRSRVIVYPGEGIFLKHRQGAPGKITFLGEVPQGGSRISIASGFNVVSPLRPKGITLGASGLWTGGDTTTGLKGGSPTTADIISLWDGAAFTDYYYRTTAAGAVGWRKAGNVANDMAGVVIPAGVAFIIKRRPELPAFRWLRPALN